MRAFSQLLDDLVYTRSRNTKLKLIGDYLKETPDPDRGIALAALTGTLDIPHVKPAAIRGLVEETIDPVLFRMSRDYVGDSAETISLLWPTSAEGEPELDDATVSISQAVERLRSSSKMDAPKVLADMLNHLDPSGRYALLKLAMGALRVGISARLAKQALADAFGIDVEAVEEVWHGLAPPYLELFDWAEGRGPQPTARDVPVFDLLSGGTVLGVAARSLLALTRLRLPCYRPRFCARLYWLPASACLHPARRAAAQVESHLADKRTRTTCRTRASAS